MHSGIVIEKGLWSHLTPDISLSYSPLGLICMSEKCKRRQCSSGLNVILPSLCQSSHPTEMLTRHVLPVSPV